MASNSDQIQNVNFPKEFEERLKLQDENNAPDMSEKIPPYSSGSHYLTLSAQFDQYLKLYEEIENADLPTNSEELQKKVEKCIDSLETITKMVTDIGLFSDNEVVEELPTSSIKFLLLPSLLGSMVMKRLSYTRSDSLELARAYYLNFLQRCNDYDVSNVRLDHLKPPEDDEESVPKASVQVNNSARKSKQPTVQELQNMAKQREEKLRRYKEKKSIEQELSLLKSRLEKSGQDDEIQRDYYMALLRQSVHQSLDELDSISMEQDMLKHMKNMERSGEIPQQNQQEKSKTSFKPFLLTKDILSKQVYGLGYPSMPTLSVEEFYEQRVKEGSFPAPCNSKSKCSSSHGQCRESNHSQKKAPAQETQDEDIVREIKIDNDDPDEIARLREKDEWRDTHRRGWGNTYNRS